MLTANRINKDRGLAIINRLHHDNDAGRPGAITTPPDPLPPLHIFITFLRSGFTVLASG